MKKIISSAIATLLLLLQTSFAFAASVFWNVEISTPASNMNTRTFQVQYTTLSTNQSDNITVEAFQNGTSIGSQAVTAGGSGSFLVTVPSDGNYSYFVKATNTTQSETKNSSTKTVIVDTTGPSTSSSDGSVVRNGNTYTLNFTAPQNSDVKSAEIYASTTNVVDTSSANLIGTLSVSPGQKVSFNFTSPDSTKRNFAIRFIDQNGNVSALTGVSVASIDQASRTAAQSAGQVAGAESNKSSGVVDKNAATDQVASTNSKKDSKSSQWWVVALLIALVAGAGYVYYANGKSGDNE